MKYFSLIFLLALSSNTYSTVVKTVEKDDSKIIHLDYNSDKKTDLIETYHKNILVKKEQDMDYDGKFDEVTEYFPYTSDTGPVEIIKKSDRLIKVYRNFKLKKTITTSQIDTNDDGKYDKVITGSEPLDQKRDDACKGLVQTIAGNITALEQNVNSTVTKLINGYYLSEPGYKVHKSCLDNWGADNFPKILSRAKNGGLSCLQNLAKQNTNNNPRLPNGALNNLNNLNRLYATTPVTLVCNEQVYNWDTTAAHASSSPDQKLTSLNITHPFLSINPNHPAEALKPKADELDELSRTIFHEQLHNLGIRHGEGVEYPYACETCCLPESTQNKNITDSSCKICRGQYDIHNKKDTSYISDLTTWAEASFNFDKSTKAINQYQQENPRNQWAAFMMARSNAGVFYPTGIEMGKLLKAKFPKLSDADKANLDKAMTYVNSPQIKTIAIRAKPIAQANLDFYYDDDPLKAITTLEKNKSALKLIVKNAKVGANDNEKYTNDSLYKDTSKILNDIFMRGYPDHVDKDSADRAYNLMKEIGID